MMKLPVPRSEIKLRLKKIEGQVRGLEEMVEAERDCKDIMIQLSAAKAAMESVAALVLRNYAAICSEKQDGEIGEKLAYAVSLWIGGKAKRPD